VAPAAAAVAAEEFEPQAIVEFARISFPRKDR